MKHIASLLALCLLTTKVFAQTISPAAASKHLGETVVVRGVVDEVHTSGHNNTFLDLGGRYPNQAFTGVIFSENAGVFPKVHSLEGKTIDLSGAVQLYHGKPEIILKSSDQLRVE
jgi:hypothetical protein